MRATLRPYVTAGIALVGASAIAVAPIAATPPDVKIPNPAVQLTAGPFDAYLEALKRVRESIEDLFLQALADPASPITVEDLLDSLLADPAANFQQFVDDIEALGPFLQLNLPIVLGDVADNVQNAIDSAAGGNIDLVVVDLILASFSLAQLEPAVLSIPLDVLGPDLVRVTTVVLVKSLNAATGPVIRGIGKTGVAIQNIINALNEDPDRGALLAVLIGAPGTIADGVLNGFALVPSPIAFPGILTPGDAVDPKKPNPGPVSLAIGLAQGLRALLTPEPAALTSFRAPEANERVTTFDLNVTPGLQQGAAISGGSGPVVEEKLLTVDADDGTNKDVKAGTGGSDLSDNKPRPRFFGGKSNSQSGGGAGMSDLREGIRDGIQGFREGVRDAVKTFSGRGDDGGQRDSDGSGEAP